MINFDKIKMPKFVFMPKNKGWFKGLGLHHASITLGWIAAWSIIGLGWFGASTAIGWYAQREYGLQLYPPKTFEVMDFVSPIIIALLFFIL